MHLQQITDCCQYEKILQMQMMNKVVISLARMHYVLSGTLDCAETHSP